MSETWVRATRLDACKAVWPKVYPAWWSVLRAHLDVLLDVGRLPSTMGGTPVLPPVSSRLRALELDPKAVRVVILGQDPYPQPGKANGLAFGINPTWDGKRLHSSFGSIMNEAAFLQTPWSDRMFHTLESWHGQGVLLLNTRLTVESGRPMSHAGLGWEALVRDCVRRVVEAAPDAVFVAWGAEARKLYKRAGVPAERVLAWSHPCKFSCKRGSRHAPAFVGSDCFSVINAALAARGQAPIEWGRV